MRTLTIRVPLNENDPEDIIGEIDTNKIDLPKFVEKRFVDVLLSVEVGDTVS